MEDKKSQRKYYLEKRKSVDIDVKATMDKVIFEKIINSKEYVESDKILTYISVGFEVDTRKLIEHALKCGKEVYAPAVTKEKMVMKFYRLTNLDDLVLTKFGVYEPKPEGEWVNDKNTLCIVPAIVFDKSKYRIGYGGGYYDYFLSNNDVKTLGIMYDDFIVEKVITDSYDQSVEKIVTDKRII